MTATENFIDLSTLTSFSDSSKNFFQILEELEKSIKESNDQGEINCLRKLRERFLVKISANTKKIIENLPRARLSIN